MQRLLLIFSFLMICSSWSIGQEFDTTSDTCRLEVPNTFSPDCCDWGQCDLRILSNCDFNSFNLKIFNRWGEVIFESKSRNERWDAIYNGNLVRDGTYTWKITGEYLSGRRIELTGHVNVLR